MMTVDYARRAQRPTGFEGRHFVAYFWFVGWWALSLGVHVSLRDPNIEIHIPFGFVRIGWVRRTA